VIAQVSFEVGDLIYISKTPAGSLPWVREAYCTQEPFLVINIAPSFLFSGSTRMEVLDRTGERKHLRPEICDVICFRAEQ